MCIRAFESEGVRERERERASERDSERESENQGGMQAGRKGGRDRGTGREEMVDGMVVVSLKSEVWRRPKSSACSSPKSPTAIEA